MASEFFQRTSPTIRHRLSNAGRAAEADDLVQDVVRWQTTNRTLVQNPPAYLARTTTGLAINVANAARPRREAYVWTGFPEPIDTTLSFE